MILKIFFFSIFLMLIIHNVYKRDILRDYKVSYKTKRVEMRQFVIFNYISLLLDQ